MHEGEGRTLYIRECGIRCLVLLLLFNVALGATHLHWSFARFNPWVAKVPWRREWQPTLVFLPGEFHGQRGQAGYSPRGHRESD